MKNLCGKTIPLNQLDKAYEVWQTSDKTWTWYVLKKWQVDDDKPYARWFCMVKSPFVPEGEAGDVYVSEIKSQARLVKHLCSYCRKNAVGDSDRDRLCRECSETFGHSFYSEL